MPLKKKKFVERPARGICGLFFSCGFCGWPSSVSPLLSANGCSWLQITSYDTIFSPTKQSRNHEIVHPSSTCLFCPTAVNGYMFWYRERTIDSPAQIKLGPFY